MLGLGIDCRNQILTQKLDYIQEVHKKRGTRIVEVLEENDFELDPSVLAKDRGVITVFEIFRAIIYSPDPSYDRSSRESFSEFSKKWIYKDSPYYEYLKTERMTPKQAIDLIHGAGGIAIWAHPVHTLRNRMHMMDDMGDELKKSGLDGIEVFSSKHNEEQTNIVYKLAKRLKLPMSAGSDFHGYGAQEIGGYKTFGLEFNPEKIIELIKG
jgi:hypothetical protein